LEAHRVVIIAPDLLPAPRAKSDTELEQEKNITYVAVTRALDTLIFQETPRHGGIGRTCASSDR
jgi:superfamily I DNA/RNA helicase